MTEVTALWLPILVSAVLVFVASSIIHMAPLWHRGDYPRMANEEQVMDALRPLNIAPGGYFFPRPSSQAGMRAPEFVEKMRRGPVAMLTVFPNGEMGMSRQLTTWFIFCLVVGLFAALVAGAAIPRGGDAHLVFHLTALTALAGYSLALWEMTIWYRRELSMSLKATLDGVIYAMITGATFMWLWPS